MCPELVPAALSLLSLFPGHPRPAQGTHTGSPALRAASSENPRLLLCHTPRGPSQVGSTRVPNTHASPQPPAPPSPATSSHTATHTAEHTCGRTRLWLRGTWPERSGSHSCAHVCAFQTHTRYSLTLARCRQHGRISVLSFSHSDPHSQGLSSSAAEQNNTTGAPVPTG